MLDPVTFLPIAVLGLFVGALIGCVGIGGVLLVPGLVYLAGMDVPVAIATCMFSFLFSGVAGAAEYARRGSIRWSMATVLCLAAMPGAYLGALCVSFMPAAWLEVIIASMVLFSGVHALARRAPPAGDDSGVTSGGLGLAGAVTGFASALSGTGGPLVLIPILVWMRIPLLTALGASQVIQVPTAALATVGNFQHGKVDVGSGVAIGVLLVVGVAIGARVAHRLPAELLRRVVSGVLVAVGIAMTLRIFYTTVMAAGP